MKKNILYLFVFRKVRFKIWLSLFFLIISFSHSIAQRNRNKKPSGISSIDVDAIYFEAQRERMFGNNEHAAELISSIIELDPSRTSCYFELAEIQKAVGNYAEAMILAEFAFTEERNNQWYAMFLADLCLRGGKVNRAIEVLKTSLRENRRNGNIYLMLATAYENQGEYVKAVDVLHEFENIVGRDSEIDEMRIYLLLKCNDLKGALNERRKIWMEDRLNVESALKYAEMLLMNGKGEEGEQVLLVMHEGFPDNGSLCFMLAEYHRSKGNEEYFLKMLDCAFRDRDTEIDRKIQVLLSMLNLIKKEEVEIIKTQIDRTQVEIYNDLIEGYQLSLEIETDEQKIKMFNDLIEGYQLALELEN